MKKKKTSSELNRNFFLLFFYLCLRCLFCVHLNLSMSIQRFKIFSPWVPLRNSLKWSKPGLLLWQQSRLFSWWLPLPSTLHFLCCGSIFSSVPLCLSSSRTTSSLTFRPPWTPLAERRQPLCSQDSVTVRVEHASSPDKLKHPEVFEWR